MSTVQGENKVSGGGANDKHHVDMVEHSTGTGEHDDVEKAKRATNGLVEQRVELTEEDVSDCDGGGVVLMLEYTDQEEDGQTDLVHLGLALFPADLRQSHVCKLGSHLVKRTEDRFGMGNVFGLSEDLNLTGGPTCHVVSSLTL